MQVSDPVLPRLPRPSRQVDRGDEPACFKSPKDYFCKSYFEVIDNIVGEMSRRFDQQNFETYIKAEQLLLEAACSGQVNENMLDDVCTHFGDDLDKIRLRNQLTVLHDAMGSTKLAMKDIIASLLSFNTTANLFSEVRKLLKFLLVIPASTATVERSFSSLRRLKTFLRNSMTQQRLNHVALLHIHKDLTEQLDLQAVAHEFILCNDRR